MSCEILYNFISPVTGKLPLIKDYILIGGTDNFSMMSPALIDMKLTIINIKHNFDSLAASSFITGFPNTQLPNSQVLSVLDDGYMINTGGIVSTSSSIPLPALASNNIWIGDLNNTAQPNPTITIDNLPNLTTGYMWLGDDNNRPAEIKAAFAPSDATYVINTPSVTLPNAQVLSELGVGMAKIITDGMFAIAIPDEDYATVETLERLAEEAAASAEESAASATEAAASATEASASALEATGAAAEATGAAAEATASAAGATVSALAAAASALSAGSSSSSASSSASDANSSASDAQGSATDAHNYLITLLNTGITLEGDITGSGILSNPIITNFKPNPTLPGNGYVKIPTGSTNQRPSNPSAGMLRYNIEI